MQDAAEYEDWWFEDDVGSSNSGYYILQVSLQLTTHRYYIKYAVICAICRYLRQF